MDIWNFTTYAYYTVFVLVFSLFGRVLRCILFIRRVFIHRCVDHTLMEYIVALTGDLRVTSARYC